MKGSSCVGVHTCVRACDVYVRQRERERERERGENRKRERDGIMCLCVCESPHECVLVHACVYSCVIFPINDTPYTLYVASYVMKLCQYLFITIHRAFYSHSITCINSSECVSS